MKISIFSGASNFTIVDGVFKEYRSGKVQLASKTPDRAGGTGRDIEAILRAGKHFLFTVAMKGARAGTAVQYGKGYGSGADQH